MKLSTSCGGSSNNRRPQRSHRVSRVSGVIRNPASRSKATLFAYSRWNDLARVEMVVGCKATCRREAPDNLMVSDKILRRRNTMSMFQQIAKAATMGAIAILLTAPIAAAEQGGRYWVPKTTSPARYGTVNDQPRPIFCPPTSPAPYAAPITQPSPIFWIDQDESRPAWAMACEKLDETVRHHAGAEAIPSRCDGPGRPASKTHRLILQVNTNDPAAMNLTLNNATNVTQHYKELGEKAKIEVVTFGPGAAYALR